MANGEKVETKAEESTSAETKPVEKKEADAPARKATTEKRPAPARTSRFDSRRQNRRPSNYRRFYRRRQKQIVPAYVDWKDVEYLQKFVPERGKIMPRRISGVSAKDQRRIARAIKRARVMALLPFVGN